MGVFQNELKSDPSGIGFAFGGMEPGRLHSHGRPIETHKVYFSIAACGKYHLHVGLRHQAVALPNSPFQLEVIPGPAHPLATALPKEVLPLRGIVGFEEGQGCSFTLQTRDKMGNACRIGGANVEGSSTNSNVEVKCKDLGDGSFQLSFNSTVGGSFDVTVTIDNLNICGMPTTLKLTSDIPDITKTEMIGGGLAKTQAGKTTMIGFLLKDKHANVCSAPATYTFGMTMVAASDWEAKEAWKTAESDAYTGGWNGDQFEMHYTPTKAGEREVYVWLNDSSRMNPREQFPGSPYKVVCTAGKSHADGSFVDGYTKLDVVVDKAGKKPAGGSNRGGNAGLAATSVFAGETVLIKPQITDKYGNPAAAPEGALDIKMVAPTGEETTLKPATQLRAGLTTYEARYTPVIKGDYTAHVTLDGAPINGSPVEFIVEATAADAFKSHYILPEQPWYTQTPYEIVLITVDKFGNTCSRGGGNVAGRLQSATLPSGQDSNLMVTDRDDGTYVLHLNMNGSCDVKTIITIANAEGPGEMTPIPMNFLSLKTAMAKAERLQREKEGAGAPPPLKAAASGLAGAAQAALEAARAGILEGTAASPAAAEPSSTSAEQPAAASAASALLSKGKPKGKGLKSAAAEMVAAMGKPDERRGKVVPANEVVPMAIDGMKDAAVKAKKSDRMSKEVPNWSE